MLGHIFQQGHKKTSARAHLRQDFRKRRDRPKDDLFNPLIPQPPFSLTITLAHWPSTADAAASLIFCTLGLDSIRSRKLSPKLFRKLSPKPLKKLYKKIQNLEVETCLKRSGQFWGQFSGLY